MEQGRRVRLGRPGYYDTRYNSSLVAVPGGSGYLFAVPGRTDGGSTALFRSSDGGVTWTEKSDVLDAADVAVGAPMTTGGNPSLYTYGKLAGTYGFLRSTDFGNTWTRMSGTPRNWHQDVVDITADPEVPGRVYVGFSGGGYAVGSLGGTPPVATPTPTSTARPTVSPSPTTTPLHLGVLRYKDAPVRSVHSGMAMEIYGESKLPGAKVSQWPFFNGAHQRWNVYDVPGEPWFVYLRNVHSGMCLEERPSATAGFAVVQSRCDGGQDQRWWVRTSSTGALASHAKGSWRCSTPSGARQPDHASGSGPTPAADQNSSGWASR